MSDLVAAPTTTSPTATQHVQAVLSAAEILKGDVNLRKEQALLLLSSCRELVGQTTNQMCAQLDIMGDSSTLGSGLDSLKFACDAVKGVLDTLSKKGFLWCLVNAEKIDNQVQITQEKIQEVYKAFQLDATKFQSDLEATQKKDKESLSQNLLYLSQDDQRLLDAIEDRTGVYRRKEELEVNIIKHVEHLPIREYLTAEDQFLQAAEQMLYRLSDRKSDLKFPNYILSSLDVEHHDSQRIGSGASGQVYRGWWQGTLVAIKRMHPGDAQTISTDMRRQIRHEVSLWATLRHENILPLYGACPDVEVPFLVMKYCPNGDVRHYLQNPSADRFRLSCDVAAGLAFLHSKSIVHADVKGMNVLVSGEHRALLADFGLSILINDFRSRSTYSKELDKPRGTMAWMSPEVHLGTRPDMASDVYSLGMTIWEIYSGQTPFHGTRPEVLSGLVTGGRRPGRPIELSDDNLWALVQKCWSGNAILRPPADRVVRLLNSLGGDNISNLSVHEIDNEVHAGPSTTDWNWNNSEMLDTVSDNNTKPWLRDSPSSDGSSTHSMTISDPKDEIWTEIVQVLPPQWDHVPWGGRMYVNSMTIPFVPVDKQYTYRVHKDKSDLGIRKTYDRNPDGSQTINFLEYNQGYGIIDTTHIKVFANDSESEKEVLVAEWNPRNKPVANVETQYAKEVRAGGVSWMAMHSGITSVTLKHVLVDKNYEFRVVSGGVDLGARPAGRPTVDKALTINLLEYNVGRAISAQSSAKVLVVDPDIGGTGTLVAARWPTAGTDLDTLLSQSLHSVPHSVHTLPSSRRFLCFTFKGTPTDSERNQNWWQRLRSRFR